MFNQETVIQALLGLVGWHKDTNPAIAANENPMGDMLTSSSGLFFNQQHPLLTIENLKSICDVFGDYTYTAWSDATTYVKNDIVTDGGNYFISLVDNNLNHAVNLTAYWRQTNPFNEWLRNKTIAGITQCLNGWYNQKSKVGTAKNLLKRSQVLDAPGIKLDLLTGGQAYPGWYVLPCPFIDVVLTINRVCIHMRESENFNLYLFRNGGATPYATKACTLDGSDHPQWIEVSWRLERGNFYYVTYNRSNLSNAFPYNAIDQYDKSNWPYSRFPGMMPFCEVGSFEHAGPGQSGWDDVTDIVSNTNNYGLNLSISAHCDSTELLVDQKSLFAQSVALSVAIMLLRELALNAKARINRNEANVNVQTLLYEIDGDSQGRPGGLRKQYDDALKAISFDWSQLSKYCNGCRKDSIQHTVT